MPTTVTIVGAGGIGSHLLSTLVPAVHRGALSESLGGIVFRVHDSDTIGAENLAHQRFLPSQVGSSKVRALKGSLAEFESENLEIQAIPSDVRSTSDISGSDIIVVAVDSSEARRVAHRTPGRWLDLRCSGDGFMAIDHRVGGERVSSLTTEQPPMSCQLEGSIESGNIQFGFLSAAAHGAQWVIQSLRELSGEERTLPPMPQSASITFGTLGRLETVQEVEG